MLSESRTVYWATPNAERGIIVFSVPNFDLVSFVLGTSDPSIEVISLMKALHVLNSHWTTLYEVSKGRNMNLVNCFFQDCLGGLFKQLAACVLRFKMVFGSPCFRRLFVLFLCFKSFAPAARNREQNDCLRAGFTVERSVVSNHFLFNYLSIFTGAESPSLLIL